MNWSVKISAASREQAQGIDQVNTAVTEMDKVTQANAATAEESAAASEEMNAQAEQMRSYVGDLVALVSGKFGGRQQMTSDQQVHKKASALKKSGIRKVKALGAPTRKERTKPEDVIPLDKDDFTDF